MGDTSPDRFVERAHLPVASPPRNHGNTTAAWVTVTLVVLGGLVMALGMIAPLLWLVWAGLGVIVVGLVVGRVLATLGFGQPRPSEGPSPDA